jgi:hypothetical protein
MSTLVMVMDVVVDDVDVVVHDHDDHVVAIVNNNNDGMVGVDHHLPTIDQVLVQKALDTFLLHGMDYSHRLLRPRHGDGYQNYSMMIDNRNVRNQPQQQ